MLASLVKNCCTKLIWSRIRHALLEFTFHRYCGMPSPLPSIYMVSRTRIIALVLSKSTTTQHRGGNSQVYHSHSAEHFEATALARSTCRTQENNSDSRRPWLRSSPLAQEVAAMALCCVRKLLQSTIFWPKNVPRTQFFGQQDIAVREKCWLQQIFRTALNFWRTWCPSGAL